MRLRVRHVLASVVLLGACGGRYSRVEGDDDGSGSSGSGSGGSGQAGSRPGGKAGQPSKGGSSSGIGGATSSAGTTSSGGKAGCICPTVDIDCAPGFVPGPDPNGCCYTCLPLDCRNVACPGIACGSGSRLEYPPDQCCPICVPDDCNEQRRQYYEFRNQVLEKYNSIGCMIDSDCSLLYENNACSSSCGSPVPTQFVMDASFNLDSYAAMACSTCPPQPVPPCEPSLPPGCFNGRCTAR